MSVDPARAAEHRDTGTRAAYFCSAGCAAAFDASPHLYITAAARSSHGGTPWVAAAGLSRARRNWTTRPTMAKAGEQAGGGDSRWRGRLPHRGAAAPRRERWSERELREHQRREVAALRGFASARSPFHRRFHRGLGDAPLGELPVLAKATLLDNFDNISTDPAVRLAWTCSPCRRTPPTSKPNRSPQQHVHPR
jgi:YHS domain-containing protein